MPWNYQKRKRQNSEQVVEEDSTKTKKLATELKPFLHVQEEKSKFDSKIIFNELITQRTRWKLYGQNA